MVKKIYSLIAIFICILNANAQCEDLGTIVISEIYFDTRYDEDTGHQEHSFGEYIELYNSSTEVIDLRNWKIKDNHTQFIFEIDGSNDAIHYVIQPGGYKIITFGGFFYSQYGEGQASPIGGRNKFSQLWPEAANHDTDIILQDRMVLYNDVEKISLYNAYNKLIDEVSYHNGGGEWETPNVNWPTPKEYLGMSNDQDYTIRLDPRIDNGNGQVFSGAIGWVFVKDELGYPVRDPNTGLIMLYMNNNYRQAIYRSAIGSFYKSGADTFARGTGTPFSLPFSVPSKPLDPYFFHSPESLTFNTDETIVYDIKNGAKVSESKDYYDDLGRNLVSLSKDFATDKIWGTETLYDSFGRKSKESFPAPTCFNFEKIDFLSQPIFKTMLVDKYYSNQNALEPYQATATYPYSEINYDKLNPANIINVVGGNKINSEWKTGYSYTVPAAQEMYYVYGSNYFNDREPGSTDIITKLYKIVNVDANGVENVAFKDEEGKILATARSGGSVSYPALSLIGTQGYIDIHIPAGAGPGSFISAATDYKVYDLKTGTLLPSSQPLSDGRTYRIEAVNRPTVEPKVQYVNGYFVAIGTPALGVSYNVNYYDYSINVYNKVGQLIKKVQPKGFQQAFPSAISIVAEPAYMAASAVNFITSYTYNSLGQVLTVTNQDEGLSKFAYRQDGQIRYSQSALQAATNKVSYTNYDKYGRAVESGVITGNSSIWTNATTNADTPALVSGTLSEQGFVWYDDNQNLGIPAVLSLNQLLTNQGLNLQNYIQKNLSGNVSVTFSKPAADVTAITWYSYDGYERLDWVVQYNEGLGIKTIHYIYDYKGNVKQVVFQKDSPAEYFTHRYTYDINNVIKKAETGTAANAFTTQADYSYYLSGELKRLSLGKGIQGLDYVYTLGGMLKSINHPSLEKNNDPGRDENDVFGMTLDYYQGDYTRSGTNITTSASVTPDYVGNIKAARWANKPLDAANVNLPVTPFNLVSQKAYSYSYNRNNWLTGATFGSTNNTAAIAGSPGYKESGISYDANGNILSLQRTNDGGTLVDNLTYNYTVAGRNQLNSVSEAAAVTADLTDIENQAANNYEYDQIGQLSKNVKEGLYYSYNTKGLVTSVVSLNIFPLVKFYYNERGQRIKKETYNSKTANVLLGTEFYSLDLEGNIMSVYTKNPTGAITQAELPIYGADRIGVYYKKDQIANYEITDHLGNVRVVIKDEAVVSYSDYYPFGEKLAKRNSAAQYRFAFQGQQLDAETGMEAFQLRLWDGRLGRWLSPDPYGQHSSPYMGMGNNPVSSIDPDGGWETWFGAFFGWIGGGFQGIPVENPMDNNTNKSRNWGIMHKDASFEYGKDIPETAIHELGAINLPVIDYGNNAFSPPDWFAKNAAYTSTHQFGVIGEYFSRTGSIKYKFYNSVKFGQKGSLEMNDTFFTGRTDANDEGRNYQWNFLGSTLNYRPKDNRVKLMGPSFFNSSNGYSISENGIGIHVFMKGNLNTGVGLDVTLKPSKETMQFILMAISRARSSAPVQSPTLVTVPSY